MLKLVADLADEKRAKVHTFLEVLELDSSGYGPLGAIPDDSRAKWYTTLKSLREVSVGDVLRKVAYVEQRLLQVGMGQRFVLKFRHD